jgi:hypothetical protein
MEEKTNNGIKVNFIVRKRDGSQFNDEQSKELGERLQSLINQLGYVIEIDEPNTD